MPAAIDFQERLGWQRIRQRIAELAGYVRQRLGNVKGLRLATPPQPALHGAMTAFRLPESADAQKLRQDLWSHRIEAPVVERPDGLLLRISMHFYNIREELDRLADVLPQLL